jgi:hypothetical protein
MKNDEFKRVSKFIDYVVLINVAVFTLLVIMYLSSCKKPKPQPAPVPYTNNAPSELKGEWVRDSLGNQSVMFANPNSEVVKLNFSNDTLYKSVTYTINNQTVNLVDKYSYSGSSLLWLTYNYHIDFYNSKIRLTLVQNGQTTIEVFKR